MAVCIGRGSLFVADEKWILDGVDLASIGVRVEDLDTGSRSVVDRDVQVGLDGFVAMGRDVEVPPEWTLSMWIDSSPGAPSRGALARLRQLWGRRYGVGEVSTLVYTLDGLTYRVYGRVRRFGVDSERDLVRSGMADVSGTFQLAWPMVFEDVERSVELSIVPVSTGGLRSPLISPLRSQSSSGVRPGAVVNDSRVEVPVVVEITGPISDPVVSGPWGTLRLGLSIPAGSTVVVDGFSRTAYWKNGGAVLSGVLGRRFFMSRLKLPPGSSSIQFSAGSSSGSARLKVRWRGAVQSF